LFTIWSCIWGSSKGEKKIATPFLVDWYWLLPN
jgi:hypothetical protein